MKLHIRSLFLIVVSLLIEATRTNENNTDTNVPREGRVYGRIVKLYSGVKPDPVLCFEEGFKADPTDCSVFYRCVQSFGGKYNVFKFQCGPGTVYDPETEVCNHAGNTKRSECRGPILPVKHEIHENDIDFRELPSPISTITPLYTSSKINPTGAFAMSTVSIADKYTDLRDSTSYNALTTTAKQQFSEAFGDLAPSWSNKYTTPSQVPLFSNKPSRSDKSDPCTSDGFIGDSYDCKKFYRCVNNFRGGFIRYEFTCGESTVWDDDKQSCNYAWDVRSTRCGRDVNDDDRLLMNIEQDKHKITSNYHYATTPNQNENIATDKANGINYGDKLSNYYNSMTSESSIGNSIENKKPQITSNYNYVTMPSYNENIVTDKQPVANYFTPNQYNSYHSQPTQNQMHYGVTESHIQVEEVKKDYTSQATSTEHAPLSSTGESDSIKLLNNICLQSGFVGDPNDCQKFHRCVDSGRGGFTRYDFSCSQGTIWDSSIEACNHAWAVKGCGSKMSSQGITTESNAMHPSSSININGSQDNEDEDIDSDYGYLNQINQENTKITTPKVETTFSSPTTFGSNVGKPCSASGFFKNTVDCKKFYKCIENGRGSFTRFEYNCGEGTVWDESIESCNHEWAVTSCKSSSDKHNDAEIMTTITLVQTTTQKNINTDEYDSIYGFEQNMPTPNTVADLTSSTTSKETLNSNNKKCNKNGFMGDKENCNKFYRCVENGHNGYTRYEFSCGDGTVWDPTIEACNHAREVEDCRSSSSNNIDDNNQEPIDSIEDNDNGYVTPSNKDPDNSVQSTTLYTTTSTADNDNDNNNNICKSEGFIGDTENCEKFYRCVDSGNGGFNRIEFSCGEGTVWDSSIEACNHRWAVENCGKSSNNEITDSTSPSVATITTDMSDTTTKAPEESHTSTQQQQIPSDNKCTSEGFFGMESEDCKKFYRCVDNGKGGYTKYEFNCGDGTVWDDSIQACNHATNNVTCGKGTTSSTSKPQPDSTSTLSTNAMASTTPTSTANSNAPPHGDKCTSEGFFADSSDCRKFIRCVDNGKGGFTKYEFSCGEGTVWVQEIQACDHDTDETTCNSSKSTTMTISTTVTEELTTSSTHGSTDDVVTASLTSTTENNYIQKNDSDKCSSEGFYPNKNDCKRFYRCVDDGKGSYTKYEFTCAEGTAWDIETQSCNYIAEVNNCQNNKIPQTDTKPDSEDNPESETEDNTTTTKPLPTTSSTRPKQNTCEEEGFFGDTEDCKKFYRCVSNEKEGFTKYDFTCGDGTIWDQDITACNHPQDVSNPSCKSDGSSSPSSSTSSTTDLSSNTAYTSAPGTTASPSTTSTTVDGSSTTTKDTNSNCSNSNGDNLNNNNYTCTKAGFYADPNDCKKFYRCVDWENNGEKFSIFHFDCGDGTIWDPALETCNHEESVYPPRNCSSSQQQNQNTTESSTTTDTPSETESTISTYETTSTSIQPSTTETESTTTTTQKSTTQSKPATTTQKSTTQTSTTQSKPTTTSTTTTTTSTQKSTTTTSTTTTTEPSTQQTSTTSSEESTTDPSTQSTTDATVAASTDQTTTNKESTTSEATTTNSYETTAMTNQMSSTTEQSTSTSEVTTATEEISPQTTDSQTSTTDSTTTNGQESTTEVNSSSNKVCPETEDDQYLYVCPTSFKRHPKYCNMFYQCTDDNENHEVKVATFNCPNNTIYDESKTQCVEENKAEKKCNGEISKRNRFKRLGLRTGYNEPVTVSKYSMACSSAGHFPFEKDEKCSPALLKCEYSRSGKLKGYVYKCPEGFVYWTISRRCEAIRKVKDCQRSSYPWDKRHDIPVETHNISL